MNKYVPPAGITPRLNNYFGSNPDALTHAHAFWNSWTIKDCELAYPADPGRCFFTEDLAPIIQNQLGLPMLVQVSQRDSVFTQLNFVNWNNAAQQSAWKQSVFDAYAGLPNVFSGPDLYHVLSKNNGVHYGPPNQASNSYYEVLQRFWYTGAAERVVW